MYILATEVIPTAINQFKFLRSIPTADEVADLQEAKVKRWKLRALMSCASAENRPTHFFSFAMSWFAVANNLRNRLH